MPRPIWPSSRGRAPGSEAPYCAEGELVTERVVVEQRISNQPPAQPSPQQAPHSAAPAPTAS